MDHEPLKEHGPDVPANYFMVWSLPVQSAGSFGRVEPDGYVPAVVQMSRN